MTQFNPTPNTLKMTSLPGLDLAARASAPASSAKGSGWDFSFANLLDIVNPLQHLPVIGTLYRAITGDTIGAPEKIAGDTLYGGLWGAVSSVADVAFEAVTGKDFGATMLAMFTGSDAPKAVATIAPKAGTPAAIPAAAQDRTLAALTASLSQKGVSTDIAQRALYAYQKSMTLPTVGVTNTVLAASL